MSLSRQILGHWNIEYLRCIILSKEFESSSSLLTLSFLDRQQTLVRPRAIKDRPGKARFGRMVIFCRNKRFPSLSVP